VILDYYIKDQEEIILYLNETKPILEGQILDFNKTLILPKNIRPGQYKFYSDLRYDDIIVSSSDSFKIKASTNWIFLLIRILIILLVVAYLIKEYLEYRRKEKRKR